MDAGNSFTNKKLQWVAWIDTQFLSGVPRDSTRTWGVGLGFDLHQDRAVFGTFDHLVISIRSGSNTQGSVSMGVTTLLSVQAPGMQPSGKQWEHWQHCEHWMEFLLYRWYSTLYADCMDILTMLLDWTIIKEWNIKLPMSSLCQSALNRSSDVLEWSHNTTSKEKY